MINKWALFGAALSAALAPLATGCGPIIVRDGGGPVVRETVCRDVERLVSGRVVVRRECQEQYETPWEGAPGYYGSGPVIRLFPHAFGQRRREPDPPRHHDHRPWRREDHHHHDGPRR